jgi:hypothetical protein
VRREFARTLPLCGPGRVRDQRLRQSHRLQRGAGVGPDLRHRRGLCRSRGRHHLRHGRRLLPRDRKRRLPDPVHVGGRPGVAKPGGRPPHWPGKSGPYVGIGHRAAGVEKGAETMAWARIGI